MCSHVLIEGRSEELTPSLLAEATKTYTTFAQNGLRTLALARKSMTMDVEITEEQAESDLTFLGIVGIIDPARPEVSDAVAKAQTAGIRVIVITGDSPDTARTVAEQIGLKVNRSVIGSQMADMTDETLSGLLNETGILFARTVPEDKFRIVKLLQADDQLVAMTGDGVNDAPALKQADVGIAMGIRGTDVAKGASDIVLSDDNFASIIAAVEEGRRQYTNIRKFVRYLLSSNVGEIIAIFTNIMLGGPLILLPVQILWMNLVTDSVTAIALGVENAESDVMNQPPRPVSEPILDRSGMLMIGGLGAYIGMAALFLYHHYLDDSPENWALANATVFVGIVVMEKVNVLNFRNFNGTVSSMGWFSNPWLLGAIFATMALQVAAVYLPGLQAVLHTVPLGWQEWGIIVLLALPLFVGPEIYKFVISRREKLASN